MTRLDAAQEKFEKVDRITKRLAIAFVVFLIAMIGFLLVQNFEIQNTIVKNQEINAKASAQRFKNYQALNEQQHRVTQQYVRCVSQVLLKPIEQRTDADFDACSNNN